MNQKAPLEIKTRLDNSVAEMIEVIDSIMSAMPPEKLAVVTSMLLVKELPDDVRDVDPVEACKYAAALGLKVASQVTLQKEKTLSEMAARS